MESKNEPKEAKEKKENHIRFYWAILVLIFNILALAMAGLAYGRAKNKEDKQAYKDVLYYGTIWVVIEVTLILILTSL